VLFLGRKTSLDRLGGIRKQSFAFGIIAERVQPRLVGLGPARTEAAFSPRAPKAGSEKSISDGSRPTISTLVFATISSVLEN